ncbi:hypothetical protein K1719_000188 [Acacia pycnantha]|nr:hypothetical protein K1719_000188 [Acacia pycnantha]
MRKLENLRTTLRLQLILCEGYLKNCLAEHLIIPFHFRTFTFCLQISSLLSFVWVLLFFWLHNDHTLVCY